MQHDFSENCLQSSILCEKIAENFAKFAKFLLNFAPTTDSAPTTFRLLSATGRGACSDIPTDHLSSAATTDAAVSADIQYEFVVSEKLSRRQ